VNESGDPDDITLFLIDGLLQNPSPVVLVAADPSLTSSFALKLHSGSVDWDELPKDPGRLLSIKTATVVGLDGDQARSLCRDIAATPHWLYIENFDEMLDSAGGQEFLAELTSSVARGELAMAILATRPEQLDRVRSALPRLLGFAKLMEQSGQAGSFEASQLTSIVVPTSQDRDDSGWMIVVRFELAEPITPDITFDGDPAAAGAMELVDTIRVIDSEDAPPIGAMIGFSPDSFTFTQQTAAFTAAALASQRLIGRTMKPGERVTATRGIYYA
jgi:hypothetical protein